MELSNEVTARGDLSTSPVWSLPSHRDQHPRETSHFGNIPGKGSKSHNPCNDGLTPQQRDPGSFEPPSQLSLAGRYRQRTCTSQRCRPAASPARADRRLRPPPPSRSFGGVRFCTEKPRHEALCMHAGRVQAGCPEMQSGPCNAHTVMVQPCTVLVHRWVCAPGAPMSLCTPAHRAPRIYPCTPARAPQHLGSPCAGMQVHSGSTDLPVHPCTCKQHRGSPCASLSACRPAP